MFWKVLFSLYVLYILMFGVIPTNEMVSEGISSIWIGFTAVVIFVYSMLLPLIYMFALGWKRQLISALNNKYLFKIGVAVTLIFTIIFFVQEYSSIYKELLIFAMREGMVPRNPDFQALLWLTRFEILASALLRIFIIFVPFYFSYYFYKKQMENFAQMKFAGRKIFSIFLMFNALPFILLTIFAFIKNITLYNIFDFLTLICEIYILVGVFCYAFGKKLFQKAFWQWSVPLFAVISFLPVSLNSESFKKIVHVPAYSNEPILFISDILILIGALYLIYKYAYTDEVYNKENNL